MADSELRQRKQQAVDEQPDKKTKKIRTNDPEDAYSPWMDILRVITFLLLGSCALSYVISSGESFFWGMKHKPWWLRTDYWKTKVLYPLPQQGPLYLTPNELSKFDGSDPSKPLYLAINGTIYDVSAGRRIYGPGGSYSYFSGTDAARAYVTGCFADDRTPDMRGVEEMFLPIEDPAIEAQWTTAEMEKIKAEELEMAKQQVHDALAHWVNFFSNSPKYHMIGYVKREDGWLEKLPKRELCAQAQKSRKKRESRHT
ncbi:hypothetical protein PT974_02579 [Cladobotryum mycophilum]|uniref:Cytochrome b5 heme-binding domain-containing protein n=1 Tax=Cladobotryum mycophilum TaxID=491253 RepID=A0ABR0SYG8_9HYPO